jgi:hypothetical protein
MPLNTSTFASPQWRNQNESSKYPFTDASSLTIAGLFDLPVSVFVDARIFIPGLVGVASLLSVDVSIDYVTLTVGNQSDPNIIGIATIRTDDPAEVVSLRTVSGNVCGTLVAGVSRWAELIALPVGNYTFIAGTADFLPAVTVMVPLTSEKLLGPGGESLGDIIRLVGENGVRLDCQSDDNSTVIHVHAVGDPLYRITECNVEVAIASRVIENVVFQSGDTTVQCSPDQLGRIFILPATYSQQDVALRVITTTGGIRFALAGKTLR